MTLQARAEAAEAETSRLEDEIDGVSTRLEAAEAELTAARAMAEALKVCKSGTSLYMSGAVASPQKAVRQLLDRHTASTRVACI